jgi:hypothetical protein
MTSPNPAGYYLSIPEPLEAAITMLRKDQLTGVIADLSRSLDYNESFDNPYLDSTADIVITDLTEANKIAFLRWMCERLAWLHSQETQSNGQS